MGWKVFAYRMLVLKPGSRRPLDIPMHQWEDNIKMDGKKVGWEGVGWIRLAEDREM
jgi:hypothetical protein